MFVKKPRMEEFSSGFLRFRQNFSTKKKIFKLRKRNLSLSTYFPHLKYLFSFFTSFSSIFILLQLILFFGCLLPEVSSYFVLARYSTLPIRHPHYNSNYFDQLLQKYPQKQQIWNTQQQVFSSLNFPYKNEDKKRASIISEHLTEHEHVCTTIIRRDYAPKHGHDEKHQFVATFIECANSKGDQCHGIDDIMNCAYSSKCVTIYELRPASIRIEGDTGDFVDGMIRVPITCQCQLYRRIFVGNTD
ncbi:hypothetical protein Mgra_00003925 [Meloidogyne graminicola]|uniref:NGF domain-containing protein n=1 Tax=Meloidogyne graminicola TaxID=189291 RepID=A0A8S9ZUE5_9BILA|nr:hypothetical protein Mgra_00003925 [Meloidogyne graminicola]